MPHEPEPVRLRIGETHRLELPGLATAGYVWEHVATSGEDIVDIERLPPQSNPHAAVGASATEIFEITARALGRARVELVQRRAWEPSTPAAERFVDIVVEPDPSA